MVLGSMVAPARAGVCILLMEFCLVGVEFDTKIPYDGC